MGIVYKAQDSKLKREVALKFISPQLLSGKEEKSRFVREARAAAALSHPNICTVYEIDEHEGIPFISMEFIEGQNLREKIRSHQLSFAEALEISIQVAEGLQQAHLKKIVHRDIKSANILVTEKGRVKVLDFGLAKPAEGTQFTKEGTTVGTVAYMSPEQVHGQGADYRTDIWSLGIVLYELITGHVPFLGDHEQAIVFFILNEDPKPLTSLRSGLPLELEHVVGKCLEKDPNYRYQNVSDLVTDLKRIKRDLEAGKKDVRGVGLIHPPKKITFIKIAIPVAAAAILFAIFHFLIIPKPSRSSILSRTRLIPFTGGKGITNFPCWSPDGNWIAYASDETGNLDIWKKPIRGGEAVQLTTTPYNESQPAWSPDARTIAFSSDQEDGGIYLLPAAGGTPWGITSFGTNPSWSPDNETLAFDWCGNIYLVSYKGGEPRIVVSGTSAIPYTVWSPDGKSFIFWNRTKGDVYVHSVGEGKSKPLGLIPSGQDVSGLGLSHDGKTLFVSLGPFGGNKNLWKIGIDLPKIKTVGELLPLTVSAAENIQCSVAPDGNRIAFTVCQSERRLWAFPLDPKTGLITGEPECLTLKSKHNYYPALSPDGRTLLWTAHITAPGVLCVMDFEERKETKVTPEWSEKAREVGGSFSPDGKQICYSSTLGGSYEIWMMPSLGSIGIKLTNTRHPIRDTLTAWAPRNDLIAFYSNRSGNWDIWSVQVHGESQPVPLTRWDSDELYPSWSPDGRYIAFQTNKDGDPDIWIMEPDGGNARAFVTNPAEEGWSAWSPDGRWFYFISNRSGAFNVWLKPAGGGEEIRVTNFKALDSGLPNAVLYSKFSLSSSRLILPVETLSGEIYILETTK